MLKENELPAQKNLFYLSIAQRRGNNRPIRSVRLARKCNVSNLLIWIMFPEQVISYCQESKSQIAAYNNGCKFFAFTKETKIWDWTKNQPVCLYCTSGEEHAKEPRVLWGTELDFSRVSSRRPPSALCYVVLPLVRPWDFDTDGHI